MAELNKNKWLSSDTFDFKEDDKGNMIAIHSESNSLMSITEKKLPNGSFTLFLQQGLKKDGML